MMSSGEVCDWVESNFAIFKLNLLGEYFGTFDCNELLATSAAGSNVNQFWKVTSVNEVKW